MLWPEACQCTLSGLSEDCTRRTYMAGMQASEDMDALQEEARHLAADRDALLAALQAVHELRIGRLDTLEDTLINTEGARACELVAKHADWAYMRNRDRVVEIVAYTARNAAELDTLTREDEEED